MMPAPYSADLQWRVTWFVYILQNSVAEASYFLGACERTVERYISGASWPFVRQYQFCAMRRNNFFAYQKFNMETTVPFGLAISVRQLPFAILLDNIF